LDASNSNGEFSHAEAVVSTIDDFHCDELICRLAGSLPPPDRIAFRHAAEDALARVPCWGEGAVYLAVAALQRTLQCRSAPAAATETE
jgi:hypothetical protein